MLYLRCRLIKNITILDFIFIYSLQEYEIEIFIAEQFTTSELA